MVIIVIDEVNQLLENSESVHHDTDETSKFLWQFLDEQNNNHNFFLIGTMNRDTKLPQPFKSRILLKRIIFTDAIDTTVKCERFRSALLKNNLRIDGSIDDQHLQTMLQPLTDCSGRDLSALASLVRQITEKVIQIVPLLLSIKNTSKTQ